MGYMGKINNLYQDTYILTDCGPEIYAMEKLDGTSAHISWNGNELKFFGGCVKHEIFTALFNKEELIKKFSAAAEKLKANADAQSVADDWVTEQRLFKHVLPNLNPPAIDLKDTPRVIIALREDVKKESEGEIVWSPEVDRAIGNAAAKMFKKYVTETKLTLVDTANEVS